MHTDLFPHLRATLKAHSYFATDLGGFKDKSNRLKVFDEDEAPTAETEYVTVEQNVADVSQLTDWTDPVVLFHCWGPDTRKHALWALAANIRDIFTSANQFARLEGTFTANLDDSLSSPAHGMFAGQRLTVSSSGTLPAGLLANTEYRVVSPLDGSFKLSLAAGGSPVDVTSSGSGVHRYVRAPLRYQVIGRATMEPGKDVVTKLSCVSLGLRFGLEA